MKKGSRLLIWFAGVELIGLVCMLSWQSAPPAIASYIWGTALVALFPGNLLSAVLIEKLFWTSPLPSAAMLAAEIPVLVAINAAIWFGLIRAKRRLVR